MINIYNPKEVGQEYNALYNKYKDTLLALHLKVWKKEDINGWDCYKIISLWYSAFLYCMLLNREISTYGTTLDTIYIKYNLKRVIDCFNCLNIPILEMLKILDIDFTNINTKGVNTLGIENNCQIENKRCKTNLPLNKKCAINLQDLIINCCTITLKTECK
jgi:hypothetical protein